MNFEYLVAALAFQVSLPGRVRLAGISLRPIVPAGATRGPALNRRLRDLLVTAALHHRQLDVLLCLDPDVVPALVARAPRLRIAAVPDPVPPGTACRSAADVRASFGVPEGRRLVLLPGALERRKGAVLLLEAVRRLPASTAASVAVVMAGPIEVGLEDELRHLVAQVRAETQALLILDERFIGDDDLPAVMAAADLIALPYVHHVGSSGFQLRAAAYGVPALVPAGGLMERLAVAHGLGPVAGASTPEAVAAALQDAIERSTAFDPALAHAFAATRTVEAFADTVLDALQLDATP